MGLGIRDDQFQWAVKFKKTLDGIAKKKGTALPNYVFLGDLNTMGMKYPFDQSIKAETELKKLDQDVAKVGMRRLVKRVPHTWWNGLGSKLPPSDLDQVIASRQIQFRKFDTSEIEVRGWPQLTSETEQGEWIRLHSDHALLYFEVVK